MAYKIFYSGLLWRGFRPLKASPTVGCYLLNNSQSAIELKLPLESMQLYQLSNISFIR